MPYQERRFWRLGEVSKDKLSISHKSGHTAYVWQKNGHVLGGPRTDNNLFNRLTTTEPTGVTFGDRFVQIGHFRIGDVDGWHFSISHVNSGLTAQIFTGDGLHILSFSKSPYIHSTRALKQPQETDTSTTATGIGEIGRQRVVRCKIARFSRKSLICSASIRCMPSTARCTSATYSCILALKTNCMTMAPKR